MLSRSILLINRSIYNATSIYHKIETSRATIILWTSRHASASRQLRSMHVVTFGFRANKARETGHGWSSPSRGVIKRVARALMTQAEEAKITSVYSTHCICSRLYIHDACMDQVKKIEGRIYQGAV